MINALLGGALLAALVSAPTNPNPWQEVRSSDDMRVWARDVPDSSVREVRAQSVVEAPPERVWDVITDIDHFTDFMPYVVEARVVASGTEASFEYLRLDPPVVSKRDYTLRVTTNIDAEKGQYVREWTTANDHGPPPRKDAVRLQVCDGSWTLERLEGNKTRVTYWLYTDPGGSIPGWMANHANTRGLPDLMRAVQKRSADPAWTR